MLRRAAVALLVLAACQKSSPSLRGPSECSDKCGEPVTGEGAATAAATSGAGGAGGATAAGGTIQGSVLLLDDVTFAAVSSYSGAATIVGFDPQGNEVTTTYGGGAGGGASGFTLSGLGVDPWMEVEDTTQGASGIMSTWSERPPGSTDVDLPVLDADVLTTIAESLASPQGISLGAAQVIVKIDRGGEPLAGVNVTTGLPGATVLYDAGGGGYTDVGPTGPDGTIILLNVPAGVAPTTIDLQVSDADGAASTLTGILVSSGAATVAGFTI